jgi:outer membrane protein OmpA-like peptidoglycan-associated protein
MARAWIGAWAVGMAILSAGCQNKMYDENKALRQQNQELQAQLDSRSSASQPQVVQPQPPPQQPLVAQTPQSAPVDQTAPPVRTAAQHKPYLGDLETTVDARAGTTTVTLPGDVFFDPGQITIKDTAKKSLDKVVAALKKEYAGKQVRIEGYTDSDPIVHSKWKSNQELSEKRAGAVRDYLVSKGVSAKRVSIVGMGDAKPRSKTIKSQNRRVEVVLTA